MLRKAPESGADVVVFDLEDAVAPDEKADAREAVRSALREEPLDPDVEVCVRINPLEAGGRADLEAILGPGGDASIRLDALMLPKVAGPDAVLELHEASGEYGRKLAVFALIETAAGVLSAPAIAASERVTAVCFGAEDLAADLGATRTATGTEVLTARQRVVLGAAAADVDAIDGVYTDFEDLEGLREETREAASWGFDGKMAIHPAQIEAIHAALSPTPEDIEWARNVLESADDADVADGGVIDVDGEMIDAPLIAQAERIRELAMAANAWR